MSVSRLVDSLRHPPKETRPSFAGRTIVITGANTGLGYEAALKFVQLDAKRVILACRSVQKGEDARVKIEAATTRKSVVDVWELDMLSYNGIQAFANRTKTELDRLDIVVLNAGVVMATYQVSDYGWEKTLQINVLSTSLLAMLLLPKLQASKTAEYTPVLELVSSEMHVGVSKLKQPEAKGQGPLHAYNEPEGYFMATQYAVSKLFLEYAKAALVQLAGGSSADPNVLVVSVCPGPTKSDLARDSKEWYMRAALWVFSTLVQHSTEVGARIYISGATLGREGHGGFWRSNQLQP
ncbi:hypothetical protein BAUCODRAFT_34238 [Baudoinia panamericana UAMH 10762]|uniref:NAD(P)-binding protein n=1 Tax=Baudoinia panamericana (strain UAMH 10762) TaxID=717646 RepID=M2NCC8_BAUPA|nr:uncharacterized protein BAUCODRAFT_34238 [Baudoinia panamericana UAMH 10762]EMC96839.1 hypothetical protein BAUCODRAFT_34238 [Baudoinia panamericana UAMH 10762]